MATVTRHKSCLFSPRLETDTINATVKLGLSSYKERLKVKKIQKELQNEVITIEKGDGAVRIEITGEQKIKKIHIDADSVELDDIGQLERWLEDAVRDAIQASQKVAAEKMQPFMGALGDLGL